MVPFSIIFVGEFCVTIYNHIYLDLIRENSLNSIYKYKYNF